MVLTPYTIIIRHFRRCGLSIAQAEEMIFALDRAGYVVVRKSDDN